MRLTRTAMALSIALLGAPAAYGQEPAPTPRSVPPQPAPPAVGPPPVRQPTPSTAATTVAPPQRPPAPVPAATTPPGRRLGSLSVVLLEGDTAGTASLDGVPTAVQRALADMREFLPFRSYRLYDAGLLRAPALGTSTIHLQGEPAGRRFAVTLGAQYQMVPSARLRIFFSLRELNSPNPVLETNLEMNVGETVIVGTSRIGGDNALIALLTAVPADGAD